MSNVHGLFSNRDDDSDSSDDETNNRYVGGVDGRGGGRYGIAPYIHISNPRHQTNCVTN